MHDRDHTQERTESPWSKCSGEGCTQQATINAGSPLCTFHSEADREDWANVSIAVSEHQGNIDRLSKMQRWSPKQWSADYPRIAADDFVDMSSYDPTTNPNRYLKDYRESIFSAVKCRSAELIYGPQASKGSHDNGVSGDGLWG
jgi:hypothetical protein